jgi:hypothetical protein
MEQYPTIKLIVEKGDTIARVIAALPLLGAIGLVLLGVHWAALLGGVAAAGVLFFLMKSYVELVRVIADMLLPK